MTETPLENCAGIILCGGMSRRMGISKSALPFGDETMLARVVRILEPILQPLVVVAATGESIGDLPPLVLLRHDRAPDRGPLEGIAVGLSAVRSTAQAAFVTGCDVPLLTAPFVRRLIELAEGHDAAAALVDGQPHPLPGVYSTDLLGEAERRIADGSGSLQGLLEGVDTRWVRAEELVAVDPKLEGLINVNRQEHYFSALRAAGFEVPPELRASLFGGESDRRGD